MYGKNGEAMALRDKKSGGGIGTTAAMRVAEELRRRILEGQFRPGQRLKIEELAALLQISHMPVRVALQTLEAEGILEVFPHRGTVIRGVDGKFIRNMYDVRAAIEGMLTERCAESIDDAGVASLERAETAFEKAAARNDSRGIMETNFALHAIINTVAQNPDAVRVLSQGRLLVEALRIRFGFQVTRVDALIGEHRNLVRAIREREVVLAGALAKKHCEAARDDLLALLDA